MTNLATVPLKRLYTEDDRINPELDNDTHTLNVVHAMFTHWLAQGALSRDFGSALRHAAMLMLLNYQLLGGRTACLASPRPEPAEFAFVPVAMTNEAPKRFYNDDGELTGQLSTDDYACALAALLCCWVHDGWVAREFVERIVMAAEEVVYQYGIVCALGELGGGKSEQSFLTQPFKLAKPA